MLKERLRRVSPAFEWENVNKYLKLQARTVTVDVAVGRLKSIANVEFSRDDETSIRSLRRTRNAIEHYEWRASEKEAQTIVGHALSFAADFALKESPAVDLSNDFKTDDTWRMLLGELYEFAKSHGARLEARMRANGEYPVCCDECGELTVPMRGGSCELCGHWNDIDE